MAKLKAPLMSLGASGKLGDALVFFGWKGLDVVREYVIPTNPKSAAQTTQRGYLADAVAAIHAAQGLAANPLDADDQIALALLGSTHAKPRTWFNEMVKLWNDCKVAGTTPIVYSDGGCTTPTVAAVTLIAYLNEETGSDLTAGKFYMGKTKTNLIHAVAGVVTPGVTVDLTAEDISGWASAGDKIYWQFRPDALDDCEGANSGIYHFLGT